MSKYWHLVKLQLALVGTYRSELVMAWIYRGLRVASVYFLWSLTAKSEQENTKLLLYYMLFFFVFFPLQSGRSAKAMSESISRGELSSYLLRPINFAMVHSIGFISKAITRVLLPIILLVLLAFIFPAIFGPESLADFLAFILTSALFIVLWQSFMVLIGSLSFWIIEIGFLLTVIDLCFSIFTGAFIPAYLFPESLIKFLNLTPIGYLGSFQIGIYMGEKTLQEILLGMGIMMLWILFFIFVGRFLFKLGLKKFEAQGS